MAGTAPPRYRRPSSVGDAARQIFEIYARGTTAAMIAIGDATGLWRALARGPGRPSTIAARAGLSIRPVEEWLGAVAAARLVRYDERSGRFALEEPYRSALSGDSVLNVAAGARLWGSAVQRWPLVVEAFRTGRGVPAARYLPDFPVAMDELNRRRYDALLVRRYLPIVPFLVDRLVAGSRVLDVGCGLGRTSRLIAKAFPRSEVVGLDRSPKAIRSARALARQEGLTNLTFVIADAALWRAGRRFGVAFAFDALHDQADPVGVARAVYRALEPGGLFVAIEPAAWSRLGRNIGDSGAEYLYGFSTLYCLMVSLAERGAGLGAAWGWPRARELLESAGFRTVRRYPVPANRLAMMLAARRPLDVPRRPRGGR